MISLTKSLKICTMEKAFNVSDRATRSEYWWFFLLYFISSSILKLFIEMVGITFSWIFNIILIYLTICFFTASVRRLHDVNRRGFWLLLPWATLFLSVAVEKLDDDGLDMPEFLPEICEFIGTGLIIYIFVLTMLRGTKGTNRFGKDPLTKTDDLIDETKINLESGTLKQEENNDLIEKSLKIDEPAMPSQGNKKESLYDPKISTDLADEIKKLNLSK